MTNKEIAEHFRELALLMELEEENPFKIRSYQNAYRNLRSLPNPIEEMSDKELSSVKGVGKAILSKINELIETGQMNTLEKYRERVPVGIREMLEIKGIGPKKIRAIWKELGIVTTGELLYACNENRLLHLKGFGEKTQQKIAESLEFYNYAKGRFLYADLEEVSEDLLNYLREFKGIARAEFSGALRRKEVVLDGMEYIIQIESKEAMQDLADELSLEEMDGAMGGKYRERFPFRIDILSRGEHFPSRWLIHTGSEEFLQETALISSDLSTTAESEEDLLGESLGYYVPPEMRNPDAPYKRMEQNGGRLLQEEQIRGVVHAHTTASDGLHSLEQMVEEARGRGYEYLTVTDHSKSAFYAGGLSTEELEEQGKSIDDLNRQLSDFRIFKGIESDILYDGSLDYPDEVLGKLEVVIISIHSQLNMKREQATSRLIRAIEHPQANILGHPTGRLLLSRPAYPIDHERIIDACAANGVFIEINANPRRLDLDWKWVSRACERDVLLSINPDAHSREGIGDIHYGVLAARKGGLTADECLNTRDASEFASLLGIKERKE